MPDLVTLNVPIVKVDREKREVWGYATSDAEDLDSEVIEYEASIDAFERHAKVIKEASQGKSLGVVREMHQAKAVGALLAYQPLPEKRSMWIGAKISKSQDGENTWKKVEEGVLSFFSIGGTNPVKEATITKDGKTVTRIKKYDLVEVSLVDYGANPDARIQLVKGVNSTASLEEMTTAEFPKDIPLHMTMSRGEIRITTSPGDELFQKAIECLQKQSKEAIQKIIREEGGEFCVYSHQSGKKFGCYKTKEEAERRIRQMQAFKDLEIEPAQGRAISKEKKMPEDVKKEGAKDPAPTDSKVQKVYNYCAECGKRMDGGSSNPTHDKCGDFSQDPGMAEKAKTSDEIKKAVEAEMTKAPETLKGILIPEVRKAAAEAVVKVLQDLKIEERLKKVEDAPAEGKAVLTPVTKGAEAGGNTGSSVSLDDEIRVLEKSFAEEKDFIVKEGFGKKLAVLLYKKSRG